MKVLHLFKTYMPDTVGGIQEFIRVLVKGTQKANVNNVIFVPSPNVHKLEKIKVEDIDVYRARQTFEYASCPISFEMMSKCHSLISDCDILHIHYPWPFADLLTLLFAPKKVKIVVSYHSDVVNQKKLKILYKPLMKLFFKRASKIIVASPNLIDSSKDLLPYRSKTVVIPYGFAKPPPVDAALINTWKSKVGDNFLLFIGQFRYYKGLPILIEAMKYYSVPLVLIGKGDLECELRANIEQLSLKNITFVGEVSDADKYALLQLARALVLPSVASSEAFGLALLEGAMFGKPLISTELGTGTSYVNKDNVTGWVIPPKDPMALAGAIKKIFTNDELTERMGAASYQRYLEYFTLNKMITSYLHCYEDLLKEER